MFAFKMKHLFFLLLNSYFGICLLEDAEVKKNLAIATVDTDDKIYGGSLTSLKYAPYQASLVNKTKDNRYYHFCGGVIVRTDVILTAAHCLFNRSIETIAVKIGSRNMLDMKSEDVEIIDLKKIIIHPKFVYGRNPKAYDVAILQLERDINEKEEFRKVIKLANKKFKFPVGMEAFATGWGITENGTVSVYLRGVYLKKIDQKICERIYGFGEDMICAGNLTRSIFTCAGDSGGPLVTNRRLVGVTSHGMGNATHCNAFGYPPAFNSIPYLYDWLSKEMNLLKKN